jgi:hypothetical protein
MTYLEWNNRIAEYFFNSGVSQERVFLYATEEILKEIAPEIEEPLNDFKKTIFGAAFNYTFLQRCEQFYDETKRLRDARIESYPYHIGLLFAAVLPLTSSADNLRANNYIERFETFYGRGKFYSNQNYHWDNLWIDLENWSIQKKEGDVGIFKAFNPFSGSLRYLGYAFGQVLFRNSQRSQLRHVFATDYNGVDLLSSDHIKEILENYRLKFPSFVIDSISLGNSPVFSETEKILKDEYQDWVDAGRPAQEAVEAIRRVNYEIRLFLRIEYGEVNIYFKLHLNNGETLDANVSFDYVSSIEPDPIYPSYSLPFILPPDFDLTHRRIYRDLETKQNFIYKGKEFAVFRHVDILGGGYNEVNPTNTFYKDEKRIFILSKIALPNYHAFIVESNLPNLFLYKFDTLPGTIKVGIFNLKIENGLEFVVDTNCFLIKKEGIHLYYLTHNCNVFRFQIIGNVSGNVISIITSNNKTILPNIYSNDSFEYFQVAHSDVGHDGFRIYVNNHASSGSYHFVSPGVIEEITFKRDTPPYFPVEQIGLTEMEELASSFDEDHQRKSFTENVGGNLYFTDVLCFAGLLNDGAIKVEEFRRLLDRFIMHNRFSSKEQRALSKKLLYKLIDLDFFDYDVNSEIISFKAPHLIRVPSAKKNRVAFMISGSFNSKWVRSLQMLVGDLAKIDMRYHDDAPNLLLFPRAILSVANKNLFRLEEKLERRKIPIHTNRHFPLSLVESAHRHFQGSVIQETYPLAFVQAHWRCSRIEKLNTATFQFERIDFLGYNELEDNSFFRFYLNYNGSFKKDVWITTNGQTKQFNVVEPFLGRYKFLKENALEPNITYDKGRGVVSVPKSIPLPPNFSKSLVLNSGCLPRLAGDCLVYMGIQPLLFNYLKFNLKEIKVKL